MARLRYTVTAKENLVEIAAYVARESGDRLIASRFTARLRRKCVELARMPDKMGRLRPELRGGLHSVALGNYVIFFRYVKRTLEVVNILEGHRDLGAFFAADRDRGDA